MSNSQVSNFDWNSCLAKETKTMATMSVWAGESHNKDLVDTNKRGQASVDEKRLEKY